MDDRRNQGGGRFVILRHEMPATAERGSHWDFMLENKGILLTWELPKLEFDTLPASFEKLGIRRLDDHRIDYLEYEGPISNNRGAVQRIDSGNYGLVEDAAEDWIRVVAQGNAYEIELRLPKESGSHAGELLSFNLSF